MSLGVLPSGFSQESKFLRLQPCDDFTYIHAFEEISVYLIFVFYNELEMHHRIMFPDMALDLVTLISSQQRKHVFNRFQTITYCHFYLALLH